MARVDNMSPIQYDKDDTPTFRLSFHASSSLLSGVVEACGRFIREETGARSHKFEAILFELLCAASARTSNRLAAGNLQCLVSFYSTSDTWLTIRYEAGELGAWEPAFRDCAAAAMDRQNGLMLATALSKELWIDDGGHSITARVNLFT